MPLYFHSRSRALVVDDDPATLEIYELALVELGLIPILTRESSQVLKNALSRDLSLIILDQQMPGISGLELARQIRASSAGAVPIIMVTADRQVKYAAARAGVTACLEKPFDVDELMRLVLDLTGACATQGEALTA
ncbi:MAG: response regulator [Deltaproteobacteria bacterium]|nr:response regulator [Deltaproteobacteria bacterium]